MKAVLTLIFIVTFGAFALANTASNGKVDTIKMGIVLDTGAYTLTSVEEVATGETSIARLYRRENSRVLKALSFTTKRSRAKMA